MSEDYSESNKAYLAQCKELTIESIVRTLQSCDIPVNDETMGKAVSAYLKTHSLTQDEVRQAVQTGSKILDSKALHSHTDLLQYIDDNHILKRLSLQIAKARELPANSVFLVGLGVFSSMACRRYVVDYPKAKSVPLGLYVIAEQPSGVGKTSASAMFQKPFFDMFAEYNDIKDKRMATLINAVTSKTATDAEQDELNELQNEERPTLFMTNATPEGLEKTLPSNKGIFAAISSEQGLFNSLFGKSYSTGASNNDIVLNGFDGGHVAFGRVTRNGFVGNAAGAIVCFAQEGSIDTVLDAGANGAGLSERFLMLSELHRLGKRDRKAMFLGTAFDDFSIYDEYADICLELMEVFTEPHKFNDLSHLKLSIESANEIGDYLNALEPYLADGERLSHSTLRGACGKIDIQIMKIAANLHLLDGDFSNCFIADKHVTSAIKIADDLLMFQAHILGDKGVVGIKADYEAILSYVSSKPGATEREIIMAKRAVKPFKSYTGNVSDLIRNTIEEMVNGGLLLKNTVNNKTGYTVA